MDAESVGWSRLEHYLILSRVPGLGPVRAQLLLDAFGSTEALFAASEPDLRAAGLGAALAGALLRADRGAVARDLERIERSRCEVLMIHQSGYPALLRAIADPPLVLFGYGAVETLSNPQVAIVGSRRPSVAGREFAEELARDLAGAGFTVVSGLAAGIDSAAHLGALEGGGKSVAVLGSGPDRVYPAANEDLARRLANAGMLVSEFLPGTAPVAMNFPRRNRIISGLSLAVVVVEAAKRSGSLITARLAGEQGREVCAVPGSVRNPTSAGCHQLIREGAALVENAGDVLHELTSAWGAAERLTPAPASGRGVPSSEMAPPRDESSRDGAVRLPKADPVQRRVLAAMGYEPVCVDELVARTDLTAQSVCSILCALEMTGQVALMPGGRYGRTQRR